MKTLTTVGTVRETLLLQRDQSYRLGGDGPQINAKSVCKGFLFFQLHLEMLNKFWFCYYLHRGSEHLCCQSEFRALSTQ